MSDILYEMVRVKLMWELWECGGKREVYDVVHDEATVINPRPSFNYPWRGQMSRAARAVRHVEKLQRALESGRYESGISDHGSFFGVTVHVPTLRRDLIRRAQWHREWYEYGKSLRKVTATVKSSP